jgi:hypothetical protein
MFNNVKILCMILEIIFELILKYEYKDLYIMMYSLDELSYFKLFALVIILLDIDIEDLVIHCNIEILLQLRCYF